MLDDDLLRQLHHVLLEVSQHTFSVLSLTCLMTAILRFT